MKRSSKRGAVDCLGTFAAGPFCSISLREESSIFCRAGSDPTKTWAVPVVDSRWATAAGELRGESKNGTSPARTVEAIRIKYVIGSAELCQ